MNKVIFHIDVNSAFLSWSAIKLLREDPAAVDLRTIPSAVGGDVEKRHGVITAKSIPARKYGVETGEPVVKALQKCPSLVLVKADFSFYRACSRAFIDILRSYTDLVQQVSIDEAYVDMSDTAELFPDDPSGPAFPVSAAAVIKDRVRTELGFTVNVGISDNKLLAKMASDFTKPDRIHTLWPEEVPEKMWPLPIGRLYGCGSATARRLQGLGIRTIGDAANTDPWILRSHLGDKAGSYIYASANGAAGDVVHPDHGEAKSYSNETTTPSDITADNFDQDALPVLQKLSASVSRRLTRDGFFASTIGIMVKTDSFQRLSRQMTLPSSVQDEAAILSCSVSLMQQLVFGDDGLFARGSRIRLIGVSAANLDHGEYRQLSLTDFLKH